MDEATKAIQQSLDKLVDKLKKNLDIGTQSILEADTASLNFMRTYLKFDPKTTHGKLDLTQLFKVISQRTDSFELLSNYSFKHLAHFLVGFELNPLRPEQI